MTQRIPQHRSLDERAFDRALGAAIRQRRQSNGLTLRSLAERLGMTYQQMQKYERGINSLRVCRLIPIARALQVDPRALYAAAAEQARR